MAGTASYCGVCGTPFDAGAAFCGVCGASRASLTASESAPVATPPTATSSAGATSTFVSNAGSAVSSASAAYGVAAGVVGAVAAVPWQTIIGQQQPDMRAFASAAAIPVARRAVQASLRKPGIAMALTTVLDLFVAVVTGSPGALAAALPRLLAGGATSFLSLVTGTKGGALRSITGVVSLVTALVQVISLLVALVSGLLGGASLLSLAPMVIATGSALVMAIKTASVALRRRT